MRKIALPILVTTLALASADGCGGGVEPDPSAAGLDSATASGTATSTATAISTGIGTETTVRTATSTGVTTAPATAPSTAPAMAPSTAPATAPSTAPATGVDAGTSTGPAIGTPLWTPTSSSIQVTTGSLFYGSTTFRKTRLELTAEQLAIISKFVVTAPAGSPVIYEPTSATVVITDSDGSTQSYSTNEEQLTCSIGGPCTNYGPVQELLATVSCASSIDSRVEHQSPAEAVSIGLDDGCVTDVLGQGATVAWVKVSVTQAPVGLRFTTNCPAANASLALFAADGTSELAVSSDSTAPIALEHMVTATGTYYLEIVWKSAAARCSLEARTY